MRKSKYAQPGIAKTFTLNQGLIDLMDEMLKDPMKFGFVSYSEIIRRGIFLAFREQQPAYKDPSPAGKIKQDKYQSKVSFEQMSDEQYAEEVLHAPVFHDNSGVPHVIMHWYGNTVQAKPVAGCKAWFSTRQDIIQNHLTRLKIQPIEDELKNPAIADMLRVMFNINVPVPDEQTNTTDT